jgi:hypothetical protein
VIFPGAPSAKWPLNGKMRRACIRVRSTLPDTWVRLGQEKLIVTVL